MGSLAFSGRGAAFDFTPRRADPPARTTTADSDDAAPAELEARRVLALLRRTLDRLPE
jgi:hypothetical protein